jgi:AcrR family transcriptional regulator
MSPKTKEQFEAVRQKSIEKITDSAVKLFAEYGYLNVSINQIAKTAGVSQGLMYNYFNSKEALLLYIIRSMMEEMGHLMVSFHTITDPFEKFEKIVRATFTLLKEKKEFYATIWPVITQQGVSQQLQEMLRHTFTSLIDVIEVMLKDMNIANPRLEAFRLGAMLDGAALGYLYIFKDEYPLEEMEQLIIQTYKK